MSPRPLPPPGPLFNKRQMSMFPSKTHLPVRGKDTAEMQHLVSQIYICLSLPLFLTIHPIVYCFFTHNPSSLCRAGQWQCTGEKCAAQCSLIGALQVTTFDKKRYSLQGGDCSYTAVEVRFITCDHANGYTHNLRHFSFELTSCVRPGLH